MTKSTHCKNGHEYTADNTFVYRGYRICITCRNRNAKVFRQRHQMRVNAWHKEHYKENSDRIIEYKRQYRKEGRHKVAQYKLDRPYSKLLADQNNCCAACFREKEPRETFFVDHDHSCCPTNRNICGKCVRGLICRGCNSALGFVQDSPERLKQLIEYLNKADKG